MWFCVVWKGTTLARVVGSFYALGSASVSSSFPAPLSPQRRGGRERVGPALCTQPVRVGDFPLCVPSGPLALLQENSAAFQGRLRPCWKRVKEFGRPKKAWITAGGGREECFEPTMLCHSALILMRRAYVCVGWVYARALTKSNKADKFVPVAMGISAARGGVASCCFSV